MVTAKEILQKLKLPLVILFAFLVSYVIWQILDLPQKDELIPIVEGYFEKYGTWMVLFSAFAEAFLFVGMYYPGGLVILLGVIFAGPDPLQVAVVVVAATVGMFASYVLNYFLGKYGWYRLFLALGMKETIEKGERKLLRHGRAAIIVGNWHPNFGSVIATAAGVLNFPPRNFLFTSFFSCLTWNIVWGFVAYFLSDFALSVVGPQFVLSVVAIWIGTNLYNHYRRKKEEPISPENI